MIRKLHIIQGLGVFKDFNWNRNNALQDFREKNVIYGWNYSGKTTLSRIFSSLRDKSIHPDYTGASFKLIFDDRSEFESTDLEISLLKVAVFNKEYIDLNLFWDSDSKLGEPIAFDVGENVTIRVEIENLDKKMEKVTERKAAHLPFVNTFQEYDGWKFTEKSKEISLLVFDAERQFNKRNFTTTQNSFSEEYTQYIIADDAELTKVKKISKATNSHETRLLIDFTSSYSKFHLQVENILKEAPTKDVVIEKLEKNKPLYDWAKLGLDFEENKEECAFCGNEVNEDRIKELNNYFSNASKELRDKINALRKGIEDEIKLTNEIMIPPSKLEFVDKIQDEVATHIQSFDGTKASYVDTLDKLLGELNRKEDGNIFVSIPIEEIKSKENDITEWVNGLNNLVKVHNSFVENFDTERNAARQKLQNHLVASYLKEENYLSKKEKSEKATKYLELYDKLYRKFDEKKNEKIDSLKTITKGKDELNKFIKKFLNRDDILIDVTSEDKFVLLRGESPATNLSEGEKTAIAFSYFLVYLESLGIDELTRTVIYIDDPISSLDNNHIAQVYSLINSFFFRKNVDASSPEKVVNCFSQLFLSTHNFEFFTFLKDSKRINKKGTCSYYFIKKIDLENSELIPLPKSLSRYKSEYIYLFELIYKYKQALNDDGESEEILIPNAMRRFLEIYTLMKIPSEPESVESRINELVDDVNQFKLLNHFSHFTTFEKLTKHDELIMILPDACEELFKLLEKDPTHYASLKKSIGVN